MSPSPPRSGRAVRILADMSQDALQAASPERVSELLADGDEQALEEAFRRWGGLVHAIAMRSLRDPEDAQDVTQQVFVAAWRSRHTLQPGPVALPRWLIGITRHAIADLHSGRRRMMERDAAAGSSSAPVTYSLDDAVVEKVYLQYELGRLGSPREDVVRLAVIEGFTHAEIATRLDMPMGTVKSHVRRGLSVLRERLEEVRRDPS